MIENGQNNNTEKMNNSNQGYLSNEAKEIEPWTVLHQRMGHISPPSVMKLKSAEGFGVEKINITNINQVYAKGVRKVDHIESSFQSAPKNMNQRKLGT